MSARSNLTPILSILIPTIPERVQQFTKLKIAVETQAKATYNLHSVLGLCEIIGYSTATYKKGGPSIGEKRQKLIEMAKGKYLCFLDDDESIAPNYIETILRMFYDADPDVVCFRSIAKMDNYWAVIDMSLRNKSNDQASPEGIVYRLPWHICPVRSTIAKEQAFNTSNYGEDWDWFERVLKKCKQEIKTDYIIHQYNHSNKNSQADNVTTAI